MNPRMAGQRVMSDEQLLELLRYGWMDSNERGYLLSNPGERAEFNQYLARAEEPDLDQGYAPGELEELMAEMTQRGMLNDPRGW